MLAMITMLTGAPGERKETITSSPAAGRAVRNSTPPLVSQGMLYYILLGKTKAPKNGNPVHTFPRWPNEALPNDVPLIIHII